MTEHPRLRDSEPTQRAGQLLAEAVEGLDRPWPSAAQSAVLRSLQSRAAARASGRPEVLWFSLAGSLALLAVAIAVNLRRPASTPVAAERVIALGQEAQLTLSPGAQLDAPDPSAPVSPAGRRLLLHSGQVCAQVAHRDLPREGPLFVETPNLKVVVIGTRFCVATDRGLSTVSVTQGRIRAEAPTGASAEVAAGESLRSDDPRLAVVAPTVVPALAPQSALRAPAPAPSGCAIGSSVAARRDCYATAAKGDGLAAQNALYGLGLLERDEAHDGPAALATWQAYAQRFPEGVFAPEAAMGSLGELLNQHRYSEALAAADRALASGDDDAKAPLQLVRAQLLASPLGQPAQAVPLLRALASDSSPALRGEALFTLGQCLRALGQKTEAADAWRRYLSEFPQGSHATEARQQLP